MHLTRERMNQSGPNGRRLWSTAALVVSAACLLAVLTGCNDKTTEPRTPTPPARNHVNMIDLRYQPETLFVAPAETVTWNNAGTNYHTATSGVGGQPDGLWDSGLLAPGDSYAHVFPALGTFPYFCTPYWDAGMIGAIVVSNRPVTAHVRIQDYQFVPDSLYVHHADTVVWINHGTDMHSSTSGIAGNPDGRWDSPTLSPGDSFMHVFPDTGSYPYFCRFHYSIGMIGEVFVR